MPMTTGKSRAYLAEPNMLKLLCKQKAMDILVLKRDLNVVSQVDNYKLIHEEEGARIANIWMRCNLLYKDILWVTEPH